MGKSKRRQSATAKRSPIESPAIRQAVQRLRDFYQDGQDLLEIGQEKPEQWIDTKGVIKGIAQERGKSRNYLWQARKFAKAYSHEQFEELCSLRRPNGKPLTPSHMIFLLLVGDGRTRKRLLNCVLKEGWSTNRLYEEVCHIQESRSPTGRRPKAPETAHEALVHVANTADRWLRWYEMMKPGNHEDEDKKVNLDDLPGAVSKALKSTSLAMMRLRNVVRESGQDGPD